MASHFSSPHPRLDAYLRTVRTRVKLYCVRVFIYSGVYWMSLMYVCYIIMSCFGIRNWRRNGVYVD